MKDFFGEWFFSGAYTCVSAKFCSCNPYEKAADLEDGLSLRCLHMPICQLYISLFYTCRLIAAYL